MKFELKTLEQLITETLHPRSLARHQLTNEYMTECKMLVKLEVQKAKENWRMVALSSNEGKSCDLYFRHHQEAVTELADCVFQYLQLETRESNLPSSENQCLIYLYNDLIVSLENLLVYVERRFPLYFDQSLKITDAQRHRHQAEMTQELKHIQKELRKRGLPEALIAIAGAPFRDYSASEKKISYGKVAYLKVFQKEFEFFISRDDYANAIDNFCEFLFYINFNSVRLFSFVIQRIQENIRHHNSIPDQVEAYYFKLKQVNQQPVKPGVALKPGLPSMKKQLEDWISEEVHFLDKRRQLLQLTDEGEQTKLKEQKIHTTLSVSHLSLAVKLLVDSNMISNKNSTELIKIVARNFKTNRNGEISESSLRNKYYTVETSTLSHMKELMMGLMKLVRQYEE